MNEKEPILLVVGDKYGLQTCDVKCYDAIEPQCDCVCGGKNHGVGLQNAITFTLEKQELYQKMYGKKLTYGRVIMNRILRFSD